MIVLTTLVCTAGAVILTVLSETRYSGTSSILLEPSSEIEPQRVVDTNLQLLALPVIAKRTAENLPGLDKEEVEESVETAQQGESDIIRIKGTAGSPRSAADLTNLFVREYIALRRGGASQLQAGEAKIVERAIPNSSPVSPEPIRNVALGIVIGLALGIGLALLLEQLDRRIKRPEDLAAATGLPILASVPKRKAFAAGTLGYELFSPAELEIFQLLRARLRYYNARHDIRSVLVTSATPGEGKSLVALGLTLAAAAGGERALLIEADLRDPGYSSLFGRDPAGGLSRALIDNSTSLSQVTSSVGVSDFVEMAGASRFGVVTAGAVPANAAELIQSQQMRDLVAEAEAGNDLVVIDSPPMLLVSDAISLTSMARGVVAVVGLGVGTRNDVSDMARQLDRLGAPTLGLVANFAADTPGTPRGYGYGRPPEALAGPVLDRSLPPPPPTPDREAS